jgi:flagellar motor switch protein FliN/FliY
MTPLERIAHYSEVPIDVEATLDRRVMTVRELLALSEGSVVKMNRSAGENIDVLIGGMLTAFGEIVIIEDSMGVRITDFSKEN